MRLGEAGAVAQHEGDGLVVIATGLVDSMDEAP